MAAAFAAGQSHRLFWFDGAAIWVQSGRDADSRGEKGRQVRSERREDVDHQRIDRGRGGGVGEMRGRKSSRISSGERNAGLQGLGRAWEMVAAGLGDFRIVVQRLRSSDG